MVHIKGIVHLKSFQNQTTSSPFQSTSVEKMLPTYLAIPFLSSSHMSFMTFFALSLIAVLVYPYFKHRLLSTGHSKQGWIPFLFKISQDFQLKAEDLIRQAFSNVRSFTSPVDCVAL